MQRMWGGNTGTRGTEKHTKSDGVSFKAFYMHAIEEPICIEGLVEAVKKYSRLPICCDLKVYMGNHLAGSFPLCSPCQLTPTPGREEQPSHGALRATLHTK
jgi:hypothetical protein